MRLLLLYPEIDLARSYYILSLSFILYRFSYFPTMNPVPALRSAKKEGDISSVFASLSGGEAKELPQRFVDIKKHLIHGHEDQVKQSWDRLLRRLKDEIALVETGGSNVIPSIDFKDIHSAPDSFREELKKRGVAVVRGVVPETEARGYKEDVEEYVRKNPGTKGEPSFPSLGMSTHALVEKHSPNMTLRSLSCTGQTRRLVRGRIPI